MVALTTVTASFKISTNHSVQVYMDTCTPTMVAAPLHGEQFTELYSFFLHVKWVYFHDDVVISIIVIKLMQYRDKEFLIMHLAYIIICSTHIHLCVNPTGRHS